MRCESVAACLMLVAFWATSLWTFQKVRGGTRYWWWDELLWTLPWFVLCPVFAVIALRHCSWGSTSGKVAAWVLGLWLICPQTWDVLGCFALLIG